MPANLLPEQFIPLDFYVYKGAPPRPHEAVECALPQDEAQRRELLRAQGLAERDMRREAHFKDLLQQKGDTFNYKLKRFISDVNRNVSKGVSSRSAKLAINGMQRTHRRSFHRWLKYFPEFISASLYNDLKHEFEARKVEGKQLAGHGLPAELESSIASNMTTISTASQDHMRDSAHEVLIADFLCNSAHKGAIVRGHIFISNHFISFVSKLAAVRMSVRLSDVATITKSVALSTEIIGPPFVICAPREDVIFNALQIFTRDKKLYRFFNFEDIPGAVEATSSFYNQRPINKFYTIFDHAWRAQTTVPCPGITYSETKCGYKDELENYAPDEAEHDTTALHRAGGEWHGSEIKSAGIDTDGNSAYLEEAPTPHEKKDLPGGRIAERELEQDCFHHTAPRDGDITPPKGSGTAGAVALLSQLESNAIATASHPSSHSRSRTPKRNPREKIAEANSALAVQSVHPSGIAASVYDTWDSYSEEENTNNERTNGAPKRRNHIPVTVNNWTGASECDSNALVETSDEKR